MRAIALGVLLTAVALAAHRVEGLIVEVEAAQGVIVVAHNPVQGYMPAMTMPFRVSRAAELNGLAPGMRIRFHVAGSRIQDIQVIKAEFGEGVRIPEPANKLHVGDTVPDFALTDQDGRIARLSDSLGRVTVINFIYTRCPMPDVCPRLSANFAYLARKLGRDVRLLTITLDPGFDTVDVLRAYAARFGANSGDWRFLTGDEAKIREVGGLFGLVYWPEEGVITHTSSTAVVGGDGRLKALIEGTSYRPDQLLALVRSTH